MALGCVWELEGMVVRLGASQVRTFSRWPEQQLLSVSWKPSKNPDSIIGT